MRSLVRGLLLLLLAGTQALALAQAAPDAGLAKRRDTAQQVMRLAAMDKAVDLVMGHMLTSLGPLLDASLRNSGATEVQRKEFVARFPGEFVAEFQSPAVRKEFNDAILDVVAADYSQEELDALVAFYSTPVAQKMVARQPAQMQMISERAGRIGEGAGRRAALRTMERMGIQR